MTGKGGLYVFMRLSCAMEQHSVKHVWEGRICSRLLLVTMLGINVDTILMYSIL